MKKSCSPAVRALRRVLPLLAMAAPVAGQAQTPIFFNGPNNGAWSSDANWNGGTRPGATQIAGINGNSGGIGLSGGVIAVDATTDIGSVAFSGSVGKTISIAEGAALVIHGTGSTAITLLSNTGNQNLTIRDGEVRLLQSGQFNVSNATRSLSITSRITEQGGSLEVVKTGAGTLQISNATAAQSTFSGGLHVMEGSLVTNVSSLGAANAVTSGPFGKGTLTLENGVEIRYSGSTAGVLHNRVAINGNIAIGNASATQAWTLAGDIDLGNGTRRITAGQAVTFSGKIENGGLTKAGASTLQLTGESTYTGTTRIEEGALALNGDGDISTSGRIEIAAGARFDVLNQYGIAQGQLLTGQGTVGGVLRIAGGTVETGEAIGRLGVDGGAAFEKGELRFKLSALENDQLLFAGSNQTLRGNTTGAVRISLLDFDGTAGYGEYLLISTANLEGAILENWGLSAFTLDPLPEGWSGALRMSGNDLYFDYQAIPEAGTVGLLAVGMGLLACRFQTRRGQ